MALKARGRGTLVSGFKHLAPNQEDLNHALVLLEVRGYSNVSTRQH